MLHILQQPGFFAADKLLINGIDISIKCVLIVVFAGASCLALRRASASQRNVVWRLSVAAFGILAVQLCLPATKTTPGFNLRPIPTDAAYRTQSGNSAPIVSTRTGMTQRTWPIQNTSSKISSTLTKSREAPSVHAFIAPAVPVVLVRAAIIVWCVVAGCLFIHLFGSMISLGRLGKMTLRQIAGREFDLLAACQEQIHFRRPISLAFSAHGFPINIPVTWGYLRPVIVLPEDASQWEADKVRAVLLHELAHVQRADWPFHVLAGVVCCLYWFNPIVWFAARKMREDCELACDEFAVAAGTKAASYASILLELATKSRSKRRAPQFAIAMVRKSCLEERMRSVLRSNPAGRQMGPVARTGIICFAVIVTAVLFQYHFCAAGVNKISSPSSPNATGDDSGETPYPVGDGNDAQVAPFGATSTTLQNGVVVKLLAVSDSQGGIRLPWSPISGTQIPDRHSLNVHFTNLPLDTKGRTFNVGISTPVSMPVMSPSVYSPVKTSQQAKTQFLARVRQYSQWCLHFYKDVKLLGPSTLIQYVPNEHLDEQYPESTGMSLSNMRFNESLCYSEAFRSPRKLARLRVGVAAGAYKDIVELSMLPEQTISLEEDTVTCRSSYTGHTDSNGSSTISITDNLSSKIMGSAITDYDRRLICVDKKGDHLGIYNLAVRSASTSNMTNEAAVPNSILKRSALMIFVVRPYYWAEFDNVKLDPHLDRGKRTL
jgi:beta-lactamase regulating signal transducer with metallopeptidase domain